MTPRIDDREEVTVDLDALLVAAGRGDARAFERLYTELLPQAHRLALRTVRDPQLAEDVTQEALVEAWRRAASFDPRRATARSWVLMITHRRAVDRVRREQRQRVQAEHEAATLASPGAAPVPQDAVVEDDYRAWQTDRVRTALGRLSALQREAVEAAFYGGRTHAEVADHLGVPLGTAKTRIRDGLGRLRDALEGA
ncbi:sigma-70 family RNA polymerase sigma factor [Demequina sp. SYSU T00039]|uniref:Sigma-70 family RNA polymerase sigma factor n=1 Tax=Demequina lignilytica TaxID=3051663 RepID=A0AAW7M858_9MICO|nr:MULTISPECIES: sigma-70 family RNA polymerase sigma factor [unclassified Demequina]MDN4477362.1 sigma-70 family RNA polymerase sigma factor [Demequina sp. SYSU T00039-1]MDN4487535.1 sigma-70 family RNA polymerase sigma factor [Demequina sp. SYSU T00039]